MSNHNYEAAANPSVTVNSEASRPCVFPPIVIQSERERDHESSNLADEDCSNDRSDMPRRRDLARNDSRWDGCRSDKPLPWHPRRAFP